MAAGTVKVTGTGAPLGEVTAIEAGHDNVGASGIGSGPFGVSPHAASPMRTGKTMD